MRRVSIYLILSFFFASVALAASYPMPLPGSANNVLVSNGSKWTSAASAPLCSALAANGTNCSAGQYGLGVDASGNAESCGAITALGTIATGVWNGTAIGTTYGGTGVNSTATFPSSGTVATIAGTQALTNKDFQGGTATDASRITIPKETTANLTALTRKQATIWYDTTQDKIVYDNGTLLTAVGSGSGGGTGSYTSVLTNGDFATGAACDSSWTSAAGTDSCDGSVFIEGTKALSIALSAVNGAVISQSVTPTISPSGVNVEHSLWVKTALTAVSVCALQAGAEVQCTAVPSSDVWTKIEMNVAGPSSGTVGLSVKTTSSMTGDVKIDDAYVGPARGIGSVAQASLVGVAHYEETVSCTWTISSSSFADYASDTDCPAPTVEANGGPGTISTTDANLPQITVTNLPPGNYVVIVNGNTSTSAANYAQFRVSDGTTASGKVGLYSDGTGFYPWASHAYFNYTTTGDRTFKLQGKVDSGTANLNSGVAVGDVPRFVILRLPSSSEQAVRPDVSPASWSGYHSSDCSWAVTNTSYADPTADSSCTFTERTNRNFGTVTSYLSGSDKLPGIVFTPPRIGRYFICAGTQIYNATLTASAKIQMWDGTTVIDQSYSAQGTSVQNSIYPMKICGIYDVATISAKSIRFQYAASSGAATSSSNGASTIEWSVFELDAAMPAPILVGSVTSSSSGTERIERATVTCSSSSSITSQSGSWVSAIGNISSTSCALTVTGFSDVPSCVASANSHSAGTPFVFSAVGTSATTVTVGCMKADDAANCTSNSINVICMGPRL